MVEGEKYRFVRTIDRSGRDYPWFENRIGQIATVKIIAATVDIMWQNEMESEPWSPWCFEPGQLFEKIPAKPNDWEADLELV